jgi:hypothetical protein
MECRIKSACVVLGLLEHIQEAMNERGVTVDRMADDLDYPRHQLESWLCFEEDVPSTALVNMARNVGLNVRIE